VGDDHVKIGC